jgi:hypothetical protein
MNITFFSIFALVALFAAVLLNLRIYLHIYESMNSAWRVHSQFQTQFQHWFSICFTLVEAIKATSCLTFSHLFNLLVRQAVRWRTDNGKMVP